MGIVLNVKIEDAEFEKIVKDLVAEAIRTQLSDEQVLKIIVEEIGRSHGDVIKQIVEDAVKTQLTEIMGTRYMPSGLVKNMIRESVEENIKDQDLMDAIRSEVWRHLRDFSTSNN